MSIFAQAVGAANQPIAMTSGSGTSAQVFQSGGSALVLTVGGQIYNGRPFDIVAQGYVKAHGASQTIAMGLQARAYATSAFSGTQIATGTASGAMTSGNVYPWYLKARLFADNSSGIMSGLYEVADGVTPTLKASTVVAALISGVSFGQSGIALPANAANPLANAQNPALQFALTFTNSVSDTVEVVSVTSFYANAD